MTVDDKATTSRTRGARDAEFLSDPYPFYERARSRTPVLWDDQRQAWLLYRYADVLTALHDPRFAADEEWTSPSAPMLPAVEPMRAEMLALRRFMSHWMLFQNPPNHTRLRAQLAHAFTPRVVEALRPRIDAIVDGLLDAVAESGRIEIIRDLAYPLPAIVIAELLGLPTEDRDQFKAWSDALLAWVTHASQPDVVGCVREAAKSLSELTVYFGEIVRRRRSQPGEDLISTLLTSEEFGASLREERLISHCLFLLQAGHETTTGLIGNGMLALLHHPDQMRRLQMDPALTDSAVEELLRYDSPVVYQTRLVREAVQMGGETIRPGQRLILLLGAANRDPDQFPNPHHLDLGRRDNRHLAFGHGIHFCLGAPLARLEGRIAFRKLLDRLADLRLQADPVEWGPFSVLRCPRSLPVTFAFRA